MNLDTGEIKIPPEFEVTVKNTLQGPQYSGWTTPLFTTIDGKIYHTGINKVEF
jgi:hypothetical protein